MRTPAAPARGQTPSLAAVLLLAACASSAKKFDPGPLDAERLAKCRAAEVAYRAKAPEYPALRDALVGDPVAAGWLVRMFVRDLFAVREGRPLGKDEELLRAAARIDDPVETRAMAEIMTLGAVAVPTLVGDLLTLAQLEGSPRPAADRWVDVGKLFAGVEIEARSLSASRHELNFPATVSAQVAGAEAELQSALANLVNNAVRYTPASGRIDVTWRVLPDGAGELAVRDTGPGIEKEHLPRLTERFYRVDGSRSRDTGGTGLGLSIVKHVVQRHGGEFDVQSEPGKGSLFRFMLPAARVRSRGALAPDEAAATQAPH